MKRNLSKILFAIGLAFLAGEALAQSQNVTINASVLKSCAVTGYTNTITVASYDPNAAGATTADGSFTVLCTKGSQFTWIVNDGLNVGATRRLASASGPTEYLGYNVLMSIDAFATTTNAPIGMTVPVIGDRATGRTNPMTLGMRVSLPANQDVSTDLGTYSDTVNVTIAIAP